MHNEKYHKSGHQFMEYILGGQDGLVNVLGVVLAVAVATQDRSVVLIAGIAAMFAESISMGAVGYTSYKTAREYYDSQVKKEMWEIKNMPDVERKEIGAIYHKKGFRGSLLKKVVDKICSNKKVWLDTMMKEELNLSRERYKNPLKNAFVIGISSLIGSIIPLVSFFFFNSVITAIWYSFALSIVALFVTGALKAKFTIGNWFKSGLEIMFIGMLSALAGFAIGYILGAISI